MKFAITITSSMIQGSISALVDVQLGDKNWSGDQPFSGKVDAGQKFGVSTIENGQVQPGSGLLIGDVTFAGHGGEFSAKIEGSAIAGEIKFGPFHLMSAKFAGVATT